MSEAVRTARGSSPHPRGAHGGRPPWCVMAGIIPASAGSTTSQNEQNATTEDHPRIRGEHPLAFDQFQRYRGSSPHPRGAHQLLEVGDLADGIIPASAGSTQYPIGYRLVYEDHPRIRGEHTDVSEDSQMTLGSSPHPRGAPLKELPVTLLVRIIPASAGSTCNKFTERLCRRDHPRIRGEHAGCPQFCKTRMGSSPHPRGALCLIGGVMIRPRIIPASAGSTEYAGEAHQGQGDHPRIRGEHQAARELYKCMVGSSPHPRGALTTGHGRPAQCRIIPASAGSTSQRAGRAGPYVDHPRIRGEHSSPGARRTVPVGSSPHPRGARCKNYQHIDPAGIIPASAGSTSTQSFNLSLVQDHPRIRGEHRAESISECVAKGSSPHPRGAPA